MEREILFRGFCPSKNGKQIITLDGEDIRGEWIYGDLIQNIDCVKIREREADINRIAKSYVVIPETVGQFTGLTDKNGKKIFEHDRVKYKDGDIAEVIFTKYDAFIGGTESLFRKSRGGVLTEVIGTIFDKEDRIRRIKYEILLHIR